MKSEIDFGASVPAAPQFPAIYVVDNPSDPGYGLAVLFTSPKEGVTLRQGKSPNRVGGYNDGWISCNDSKHWSRLPDNGFIKLSNSQPS